MNIRQLMKQAQQMQETMQREMAGLEVDASVGGGMVTVRMDGHKQLLAITLDPEILDPDDASMAQDLVLAAVNEASRKVDDALQSKLGGGMPGGLPGAF